MNFVDYTGRKYGKLTVLRRGIRNEKRGLYEWVCKCDCGTEKSVIGADLKNGNTTSCGCMSSRNFAGGRTRTHGMSETPLYAVWRSMRDRCKNKNNKSYKDYGARGITVCDEWNSFEKFYADMGSEYSSWLTIERIDSNKNYEKSNCKWIPKCEQSLNRRNNTIYVYKGDTLPLQTLCKKHNVNPKMVRKRIALGWTVEEAIEKPVQAYTKTKLK